MDSSVIEQVLNRLNLFYYTDLFVIPSIILAIITAIRSRRKETISYLFIAYSFGALLLLSIVYINILTKISASRQAVIILEGGNIAFGLLEYITFYYFFKAVLISSITKSLMKYFFAIFFIAILYFYYVEFFANPTEAEIIKISDLIISFELLFLVFPCIIYYFELLAKKPVNNLLQSPSFWIVSGLFFYTIIIIPFFSITDMVLSLNKEIFLAYFSVHYLTIGLLFLAITKAFLCKKPLTT